MMKIVRVNRVYLVLSAHREVLERFTTFAEARTYITAN